MKAEKFKAPKMGLHKGRGLARVTVKGQTIYLGPHGSSEAVAEYARIVEELRQEHDEVTGKPAGPTPVIPQPSVTVAQLLDKYVAHAEKRYQKNGRFTSEVFALRKPVKIARELFGAMPARSFGEDQLKRVRMELVEPGLSRVYVNGCINRLRRSFRWAAKVHGLVPAAAWHMPKGFAGLDVGETDAPETETVTSVPWQQVRPVLRHVSRPVRR